MIDVKLKAKVLKIGNSQGIIIPADILKLKGWPLGTELTLELDKNGRVVVY